MHLTELVYLAAPFETGAEREFNRHLAELARSYNFPMYLPQEVAEQERVANGALDPEHFRYLCTEALKRSNLVVAVAYADGFDPVTSWEIGYAMARFTNVIAVRNRLLDGRAAHAGDARMPVFDRIHRVIEVTAGNELSADRLIPVMNRWFETSGIKSLKL